LSKTTAQHRKDSFCITKCMARTAQRRPSATVRFQRKSDLQISQHQLAIKQPGETKHDEVQT
jgi:hypothetical protein